MPGDMKAQRICEQWRPPLKASEAMPGGVDLVLLNGVVLLHREGKLCLHIFTLLRWGRRKDSSGSKVVVGCVQRGR